MLFYRLQKIITNGNYNKEILLNQLDVFFLSHRLTEEEYRNLIYMLNTPVSDE